MKILAVHNDYQILGGETAVFNAEVRALKENGHTVISYSRSNKEIEHYGFIQKAAFFPKAIFSRQTYREIKRLVEQEHPDIAHIHNVFPLISPSAYRALYDAGIPIVQTLHNYRFLCPNGLFLTQGRLCERCKAGNTLYAPYFRCFRGSFTLSLLYAATIALHRKLGTFNLIAKFIALNEFTKNKFIEAGFTRPEKITVLGNFLPLPLPEPSYSLAPDAYVAYLGRLSEEKGIETLIRVVGSIPGLPLKIAGDGPERHQLEELTKDLKLDNVEFVGQISGEDKWSFLRNALCMVVPSKWYEIFPISLLEGMVVGTPVICSDLGGLPNLVKGGQNGLLFNVNEPEDLKRKIAWLLHSPDEAGAIGRQGRETVEKEYTSQVHFHKLVQIFETLCREKR